MRSRVKEICKYGAALMDMEFETSKHERKDRMELSCFLEEEKIFLKVIDLRHATIDWWSRE